MLLCISVFLRPRDSSGHAPMDHWARPFHLRFSSGQGPRHWWGEENDGLLPHLVAVIRLEFITKREHQGNPIIWDRATDFVPLRHIAALSLPQPTNLRRLPGPPVYIFWGDGKPPWLGGPKAHARHYISIHVDFASHRCPFFWFTWKWDFATLPLDTRRHDTRYTCPGSSSDLMILKGSDGVPWPCHQPRYIYRHFLPIESMITFGLQCQ